YSDTISGTPWYMAPECFRGKRNELTDVWAVGVILYELLEGRLPFPQRLLQELHDAIANEKHKPLSQLTPVPLQVIILRALAKQPEARYETSADMRQALRDLWQSTIHEEERISTIEQTTKSEIA